MRLLKREWKDQDIEDVHEDDDTITFELNDCCWSVVLSKQDVEAMAKHFNLI